MHYCIISLDQGLSNLDDTEICVWEAHPKCFNGFLLLPFHNFYKMMKIYAS